MNIKMEKEAMQKLFDEANTNKGDINIKDKSQVPPLHWKGWEGGGRQWTINYTGSQCFINTFFYLLASVTFIRY